MGSHRTGAGDVEPGYVSSPGRCGARIHVGARRVAQCPETATWTGLWQGVEAWSCDEHNVWLSARVAVHPKKARALRLLAGLRWYGVLDDRDWARLRRRIERRWPVTPGS